MSLIAGVDEAGRGAWAGPVFAAAVILSPDRPIEGLTDSKLLTPARRERLFESICEHSQAFAIASVEAEIIDQINILQATLQAMRLAVLGLSDTPHTVWVDGISKPSLPYPVETLINGDRLMPAISAASILAKVARDRLLKELALQYPQYGFEQHKGYGTAVHQVALKKWGPCAIHRKSFAPIRALVLSGDCV